MFTVLKLCNMLLRCKVFFRLIIYIYIYIYIHIYRPREISYLLTFYLSLKLRKFERSHFKLPSQDLNEENHAKCQPV
jgi:hypothetical protein